MIFRIVLVGVWLSVFALFTSAIISSEFKQPKRHSLSNQLRDRLSVLRDKGHQSNNRGKYGEAAKCYSAALQCLVGVPGDEAYELRRRCGLNLAYCNLKEENYSNAIARCSDVIDESSNFFNESGDTPGLESRDVDMLRQALATAHRRRYQALKYLNKDDLAEVDLAFSKFYKSNANINQRSKVVKKYQYQHDALQDFVEECQSLHPVDNISKKELISLCSPRGNLPDYSKLSLAPANFFPRNDGSSLGNFGNDMNLSSLVRQFGPMLGMSNSLISAIATVLDVYRKFSRITSQIALTTRNNKELIVAGLTILVGFYFFL